VPFAFAAQHGNTLFYLLSPSQKRKKAVQIISLWRYGQGSLRELTRTGFQWMIIRKDSMNIKTILILEEIPQEIIPQETSFCSQSTVHAILITPS
jgi:diphthamide synthase (EF-2-diphthine--ammonia ligase)